MQCGKTPLHYAVEKGRAEVVSLLLGRGANIDAEDQVHQLLFS
jgi:ankyrin repeat protein